MTPNQSEGGKRDGDVRKWEGTEDGGRREKERKRKNENGKGRMKTDDGLDRERGRMGEREKNGERKR